MLSEFLPKFGHQLTVGYRPTDAFSMTCAANNWEIRRGEPGCSVRRKVNGNVVLYRECCQLHWHDTLGINGIIRFQIGDLLDSFVGVFFARCCATAEQAQLSMIYDQINLFQ